MNGYAEPKHRMRLVKATIAGYRSIRNEVELTLDDRVTIVLGANDHGKSNLLKALSHLNPDQPFEKEPDLNWDCTTEHATLPSARYTLRLSDPEREELRERERLHREQAALQAFLHDAEDSWQAAHNLLQEQDATPQASEETAQPDDKPRGKAAAARRQLEAAQQRKELAAAALFVNHAVIHNGAAPSTAIADALLNAKLQLDATHTSLAKAKERVEEAELAAKQATNKGPNTPNSDSRLDKASVSARTSQRRLERELETVRANVTKLEHFTRLLDPEQEEELGPGIKLPNPRAAPASDCPTTVELSRAGVGQPLKLAHQRFAPDIIEEFVLARLPKVVEVRPVEKISDSVNRRSLDANEGIFMRGIFHYAGLPPEEWDGIFARTDVTTRRLADASAVLNKRLRESWSQGEHLDFVLQHDSANKRIELVIRDPAVEQQYVRVSRRSSGFTHFFALKTILNAHQQEAAACAYVWVFDEPGVHLHPVGQHDLVQVMETLARMNQVVYTTHSIFMANKNFPLRHRLVVKADDGSKLDGKPFVSRWHSATEALGMSMPGTLLFASRVLLVEGDSDPLLINAVLQKLIEIGRFDRDVNSLVVMASGPATDTAAIARILRETPSSPTIAALLDGDGGGRDRQSFLKRRKGIDLTIKQLTPDGTTTEDHLPAAFELYPKALAAYLAKVGLTTTNNDSPATEDEYYERVMGRIDELEVSSEKLTTGLAAWSRKIGKELSPLIEKPSPVGVAREYALLLQAARGDSLVHSHALDRPRRLADWIAETLNLPSMTLAASDIIADNELS
ncbi:MAG: AAA family ATPase [Baekduia sp.]